ncbi:MAG: glycoside hydrolase family 13 protein [Bacteroidales bacterium]
MKRFIFFLLIVLSFRGFSQEDNISIEHLEPPFWWTNMAGTGLQLMVHGNNISNANPVIREPGIIISDISRVENPNYLFIDLTITKTVVPGIFQIVFRENSGYEITYDYELKSRIAGSAERVGFSSSDAIYLLMPDRFSNGNTENDNHPKMIEKTNRTNPDGRHGGDIAGIKNHLQYISNLGATTLWINPLVENNNPEYSYHGYAITDFYKIDPRFGTNDDYRNLVSACHEKGIKVIMDMVFNHCSIYHWFIEDQPSDDWIHQFEEFTKSNFRASTIMDPHASEYDRELMLTGWFDKHMADLDQRNQFLSRYLIQNTIWWIEYAGLDGIRIDTQPYSYKEFISEWSQNVFFEYPNLNVLGEAWLQKESFTAYFQEDSPNTDGYNSGIPSVTDFPMYFALNNAFKEDDGWTTGLAKIYYVLAHDNLYGHAEKNLIFCDNHDLDRFYTSIGKDVNKWKMAMAALATLRGIPMIYYGTEILMEGEEHKGHGYIRKDFPGGWPGDVQNSFTKEGRTDAQNKAFDYLQKLLNWRKKNPAILHGKLKQFVPDDDIYVYFRYTKNACVMVIFNNSINELKALDTAKYKECIGGYSCATNVVTNETIKYLDAITITPKSVLFWS